MKRSLLISAGCLSLFAVSCAHKSVEKEITVSSTQPTTIQQESKPTVINKTQSQNDDVSLTCSLGNDSRTLVLQKGDKRCEVHYSKSGTSNNVAWAEKTPTLCDKVFDNVKNNVEKGGFKCTDDGQKTASINN